MDSYESSDMGGRGRSSRARRGAAKRSASRSRSKSRKSTASRSKPRTSKWMAYVKRTLASMKREKKANSKKAVPTLARAMKRAAKTYKP